MGMEERENMNNQDVSYSGREDHGKIGGTIRNPLGKCVF
jgi:hypothetical protein